MKGLSVLVLDDEAIVRREIREFLSAYGYAVHEASLPSEAFDFLSRERVDVMLLDVRLPEIDGIAVLARLKSEWPDVEVIMMSGHGDMDTTIAALRGGAFDFFKKPLDGLEIRSSIERTKRYIALSGRIRSLESTYAALSDDVVKHAGNIIGASAAMKAVIDRTVRAAASDDTPVMITGESGSGKELIARVIHFAGARKDEAFFPVNCPAIPDTLIESELFGAVRGAYTGAEDRAGCFETAHGGTIFLDEIGDMPLEAQAKMLRVMEDKKVRRVGGTREIPVNVRVVCATNKDLRALIAQGKFREDLFYRLSTVEIAVPPLRERREDIPLLAEHYVKYFAKKLNRESLRLDAAAADALASYRFPGNVRELKNIIERAMILCDGDTLAAEHFPLAEGQSAEAPCDTLDLEVLERSAIERALAKTSFNKTKASELLGITIFALSRKMEKFGIKVDKKI